MVPSGQLVAAPGVDVIRVKGQRVKALRQYLSEHAKTDWPTPMYWEPYRTSVGAWSSRYTCGAGPARAAAADQQRHRYQEQIR